MRPKAAPQRVALGGGPGSGQAGEGGAGKGDTGGGSAGGGDAGGDCEQDVDFVSGLALFRLHSCINHSCCPNAHMTFSAAEARGHACQSPVHLLICDKMLFVWPLPNTPCAAETVKLIILLRTCSLLCRAEVMDTRPEF